MTSTFELVIKPRNGWETVDLREIWHYRELLGLLVWRDIKIRYKQTILGGLWAILQPLIGMFVFGVLFNRVANIRSDGPPYLLFLYTGLLPWTFFANAVGLASNSLISSEQMIRKIYFPRLLVPLGTIAALALDMFISFGFLAVLMVYYRWPVTASLAWLPLFILMAFLSISGLGLLLAAINVQYRDVKYVVPFFTQMMLFVSPVLYPLSYIPARFRTLMGLNPMAGTLEGFRYAILGSPITWPLVWTSMAVSVVLFVVGAHVFRRMERTFADVI